MKNAILALVLALSTTSCLATQDDFERLGQRVGGVESALETFDGTPEAQAELQAAVGELRQEVTAGAQRVQERGQAIAGQLADGWSQAGLGGVLVGGLSALFAAGRQRRRVEVQRDEDQKRLQKALAQLPAGSTVD